MSGPDLICLGEPLVEFVELGAPGGDSYRCGVGGDTSNAAIAAARHGARVGYLTALGQDRFGDRITDLWAREGIDAAHVRRDAEAPTGIYFVHPDPAGRDFTYYRTGSAAALMRADALPLNYIRSARALHLSGISLAVSDAMRGAALKAAEVMHEAGGTVSIDTNLRLKLWSAQTAREVIHGAMRNARIAITSIDDSHDLTGLTEPDKIIDFYQSLGPEIVIVTMGGDGCAIASGARKERLPAYRSTPIDSTGAGDSFAGSFLARWLQQGDPFDAARYASIVAAKVVSGYGAVDPIPDAETVVAALRQSAG
ncbi:sugar kinase [Rhodobacteraceae bacterium NNCM2]|nr:sugar kinase [Coraliihabitans acroporae]